MVDFYKRNKPLIFIILIFLIGAVASLSIDPDVYWHIKTGEWILENGIPTKDTFSYFGGNFLAHEWLFDIILFLVYSIGGFLGVKAILLFGPLISSLILSINISKKRSSSSVLVFLLPIVLILKYSGLLSARPHMISLLFICIEIYMLESKKYNWLWLFPIFTLFIANVHGGSVSILTLILVVYLIDYIYNNLGNLDKKFIIKNIVIAVIMMVTMIVTPYGIDCALYGTKIPQYAMEYVSEWYPLVSGAKDIPILFLTLVPFACMAYSKKAKLIDILMLSMGFMMTIVWCRMILIYACLCIVYASGHMSYTFGDILNKFKVKKIRFPKFIDIRIVEIMFLVVLSALLCISISNVSMDKLEKDSIIAPEVIKNYIVENDIDIENNIMFNHYNFGGYFIFHDMKVFMDGRNDVYCEEFGSPAILPDYLSIWRTESNTLDLIKEYNIRYFSIYKDCELHSYLLDNHLASELVSDDDYVFLEISSEILKMEELK